MANKITDTKYYSAIADAIRAKNGSSDTYYPADMAQAIEDIPSGGGMDENLAKLLAGTAVGDITITGVTDLSMTRISLGDSDGQNNNITGLHFPNLVRWCHSNINYAAKSGGLIDMTSVSSSARSASIQTLDIPECTNLYMGDPRNMANNYYFGNLKTLNAPKLTLFSGCLRGCGLTALNLPSLTKLSVQAFLRDATSLTELRMPKLFWFSFGNYYFYNCTALRIADLGEAASISSAFMGTATSLEALVLRRNGVCSLNAASEFSNSPIASGTGYIYVPRDQVVTYEAATNWSTYAGQFRALEDYTDDGTLTGEFIMPTA
jgi:hypothetical protein